MTQRAALKLAKLALAIVLLLALLPHVTHAQEDLDQQYISSKLGLSFGYPTGWEVEQVGNSVIAGFESDFEAIVNHQLPVDLVVRITEDKRSAFGLTDSQSLPELIATLGKIGTPKSIKVNDYPALQVDLPDNSGVGVAVRIDEQRWALIIGQTQPDLWADNAHLFDEVVGSVTFGTIGNFQAVKTVALKYGAKVHQKFVPGVKQFLFTFNAKATELVTITMVADKDDPLDPALVLIGPDNNVVAQNDDSLDPNFGLTNARLVNFPIPKSGTYTIEAQQVGTAGSGFTLTLDNKAQ